MHCPHKFRIGFFAVLGLIITGLVGLNAAQAQAQIQPQNDVLNLMAIPPRLGDDGTLKGKPGETVTATVKVKNNSPMTVSVGSIVRDFVIADDGQTPLVIDEPVSSRWSLSSWITVAPSTQTLTPGQVSQLSMVIQVPPDALPGGHYAMLLHEPQIGKTNTTGANQTLASVNPRVGTLIYFIVDGPINEQAFIRNLAFPTFTEYGPVAYSYSVENLSDVHIRPNLTLEVRNLFGRVVERTTLESKNVFPLSTRHFTGKWDRVWGWGYYSARVVMNYGSGGQIASMSTGFWLFPITLVLAILVGILTLIAMFIVIRRYLLHKRIDQTAKIKELEAKVKKLENK